MVFNIFYSLNDHFKCKNYYCVFYRYTCDGKNDCPLGDDEFYCSNRTCHGLFRCRNSGMCLHHTEVSDGKPDCNEGDDELFNDIPPCPPKCYCLMSAMTCMNQSFSFESDNTFLYTMPH